MYTSTKFEWREVGDFNCQLYASIIISSIIIIINYIYIYNESWQIINVSIIQNAYHNTTVGRSL